MKGIEQLLFAAGIATLLYAAVVIATGAKPW